MENWAQLIQQKLEAWGHSFFKFLPNMLLAFLVFILFLIIAKIAKNLFNKLLSKIFKESSVASLFSNILYLLIFFVGLFTSLQLLHLEKTISSLLAGAGIVGLALGFAFQDLTANFISGVFIIFRKPFQVGHIVDTNGFVGTIEAIQLRSTTIRTFQGLHVILPNKDIFQKPITNYSLSGDRRIDITLTIPAKVDTDRIEQIINQTISGMKQIHSEKKSGLSFTDYTGDTVKIEVHFWIDNTVPHGFTNARNEIIRELHKALGPVMTQ